MSQIFCSRGISVSKTPATSVTTYISIWKSEDPQLMHFLMSHTELLTIDGGGDRHTAGCPLVQMAEIIRQFFCLPLVHEREVIVH